MLSISHQEVILKIKKGGKAKEMLLKALYENKKVWQTVLKYVQTQGGKEQETKEIFQESIITLNRKISEPSFELTSNLSTYFIGICKLNWKAHQRKIRQKQRIEQVVQNKYNIMDETPETIYLNHEKKAIIEELTNQIGEKCKKMLELYGLSYSMQEIAEELGYKNKNMSKKAVARCRKKLKQLIQQYPRLLQLLKHK